MVAKFPNLLTKDYERLVFQLFLHGIQYSLTPRGHRFFDHQTKTLASTLSRTAFGSPKSKIEQVSLLQINLFK